jgi:TolB-like protein
VARGFSTALSGSHISSLRLCRRYLTIAGTAPIVALVIALGIWYFFIRATRPPIEIASVEKMAFRLPDKPSIAVLPFDNLSGDPEQEYFCDGMTEDLITDLSKISGIFVIARNSTFTYKGKPVKIKQVAEELGVRYVLEGSVRKAEDKVRINAQLIDAINGHHLWAERYTGNIGDVFSLQDKITQDIVSSLAVKLTGGEQYSLIQKETNSIEAYDNFLKGWAHYLRFTPKDIEDAFYFFLDAIALDPNYGRAWAAYTACLQKVAEVRGTIQETLIYSGWEELRTETREGVIKAMENPSALAYQVAAEIESKQRLHEAAIEYAKQAVSIDPNNASFLAVLGKLLIFAGKPNEAVSFIRKAERHDPYNQSHYLFLHGLINFQNGQLDEAMILFERAIANNPEFYLWRAVLAATYALVNRIQSAQSEMDKFKKMSYWTPTLEFAMFFFPFKDSTTADRLANGLIKAGLRKGHLGYYSASNESRLSGEKIRRLTFGQTIEGVDPLTGVPYKIDIGKDGKAAYKHKFYFTSYSGKSWIEGEKLCYEWSGLFHSFKYCSPVFRNIKPSSDTSDDYLLATDWGIYPFSLVD